MPTKIEAIQWSAQMAVTVQNTTSATLGATSRRLDASRAALGEREKNFRDLMLARHDSRRQYRTGINASRLRATRVATFIESGARLVQAEDAILEATAAAQAAEEAWLSAQREHRIAAGRVTALIAVARLVDKEELSAFVTHRRASV